MLRSLRLHAVGYGLLTKIPGTHAPRMPGTLSPPPTSKETTSKRSRQALPHMRHARAVMHIGIANLRWRENVPGIPDAYATHNFSYLVRGQLLGLLYWSSIFHSSLQLTWRLATRGFHLWVGSVKLAGHSPFAIRHSMANVKSVTFDVWSYLAIQIQLFIFWRGKGHDAFFRRATLFCAK